MHWRGVPFELPIVGVLGLLGISSVLAMVFITHPIGRVAGPAWLILGLIGYTVYRKRQHRPVLHTVFHDWPEKQLAVYEESGETALAEEYREALKRRARKSQAVILPGARETAGDAALQPAPEKSLSGRH
jgi:APA family basic amino acid/polyamine antiporter